MAKDKVTDKKTLLKKAVDNAIRDGKTLVVFDDRPCSVEISKGAKGNYTFCLKAYVSDEKEMLKVVPTLNSIRKKIEKHFK